MNSLKTLLLTCGLLLLVACNEAAPPIPKPPQPALQGSRLRYPAGHEHLALVSLVAAAPAKSISLDMPARLVWNEEKTQRIYPPFAGRVVRIVADVGQRVRRGGVLAELASPDFGQAQADTVKAQADSTLSAKTLARQRELFEAGIVARKDLELAEAEAARSQAEMQRSRARTRLYGDDAGRFSQALFLTAGIDAYVVERNLTPGLELRPDQSGPGVPPLFVLSDPTSLWVLIDVRESEIDALRVGAGFQLITAGMSALKVEGRITAIPDAIDPATRTIKVRGLVPNADRALKAEMLATAHMERNLGSGVVVPSQSVTLRGAGHSVIVQVEPNVFEWREVSLGYQGPREVVVTQGLKEGERVVSDNMLLLARQFRIAQAAHDLEVGGAAAAAKTSASAASAASAKASGAR